MKIFVFFFFVCALFTSAISECGWKFCVGGFGFNCNCHDHIPEPPKEAVQSTENRVGQACSVQKSAAETEEFVRCTKGKLPYDIMEIAGLCGPHMNEPKELYEKTCGNSNIQERDAIITCFTAQIANKLKGQDINKINEEAMKIAKNCKSDIQEKRSHKKPVKKPNKKILAMKKIKKTFEAQKG